MKSLKAVLAGLLAIVFVAWSIFFIYDNPDVIAAGLGLITAATVFLGVFFYSVGFIANALILQITVKSSGSSLSFLRSAELTGLNAWGNLVLPWKGGFAIKTAALKFFHGLSVRRFLVVSLAPAAYLVVFSLAGLAFSLSPVLSLTGLALSVLATHLLTVSLRVLTTPDSLKVAGLSGVVAASQIGTLWAASSSGNFVVMQLDQLVTLSGGALIAGLVSLTPAAWGVREFFLIQASSLHGLSGSEIFSLGIADRTVYLMFLVSLGVVLLIGYLSTDNMLSRRIWPKRSSE